MTSEYRKGKVSVTLWCDPALRAEFVSVCSKRGISASQVLRNAMRVFVGSEVPALSIRETVGDLDDEAVTFD